MSFPKIIGRVRGVGKNRKCPDEKSGLGVFWQTAPRAAPSVTTKPGKVQAHHIIKLMEFLFLEDINSNSTSRSLTPTPSTQYGPLVSFNLNIIHSIFSLTIFFIKTINLNFTEDKMFRRNSANIQFLTLPWKTNSSNQAVKVEREEFRRVDKRLRETE